MFIKSKRKRNGTKREGKTENNKQEKNHCNSFGIKKEIKKSIKTKKGITSTQIIKYLKCMPNFLGCFAENELNFSIQNFPSFIVVNLDSSTMPGSHWIGIGLFRSKIEIFDPLGFNVLNWPRIPCNLLNFLHRNVVSRQVKLCRPLQDSQSVLCGFYVIFYIIARQYCSFFSIQNLFSSKLSQNDCILLNLF